GGLARVNRAADLWLRHGGAVVAVVHLPSSFPSWKKWKPLQCCPVIALATALSDLYRSPWNSKPFSKTLTVSVSPLYTRVRIVPGGGRRLSPLERRIAVVVRSAGAGAAISFGGDSRTSASLANSAARWRARSERSPSANACSRQAMRLTSHPLLLALVSSPNASAYLTRSSLTVIRGKAATSF